MHLVLENTAVFRCGSQFLHYFFRDYDYSRGNKYYFWSIFVSMPEGVRRGSDLYCPIGENYELAPKNEMKMFSSFEYGTPST